MKRYCSIFGGLFSRLLLAGFILCCQSGKLFAQDKISQRDANEISYQAESVVEDLQNLLNYVTFNDNAISALADVIKDSYRPSRNQVFSDGAVIVENDIDPDYTLGNTKDLSVAKYLDALDLQYDKTSDASVSFSNITVSKVKKKEYIYVKVHFDEAFASNFKPTGKKYMPRQREALVRLFNQGGNKWQALIIGLSFYDVSLPENSADDLQITKDASDGADIVSQEEFLREKDSFILAKQQEEKRRQANFEEYITLADGYVNNKQYREGLEMFYKAKEIRSLVPSLDKKILDAKKAASEYTFEAFKNRADQAKSERRYSEAMQYYKKAVELKPEANPEIAADMAYLTKKIGEISLPKNKLDAGDYQGAIEACDNILKENKKAKNDFSEIYYLKGKAYELAATKQPSDTKLLDRALDNYGLAVQYFPNYVTARIARANFYVKYKRDYVSAITDYDVVANNTLDYSPDKPKYLLVEGKWKDQVKNYSGALEDYNKAIALSPDVASPHFEKGELLYRLGRYEEALNSFSTVVKLDAKNSQGYYYRGLSYIGLKDAPSAGVDFSTAEKLGLEPAQLKMIESVSASYFDDGLKAFNAKGFGKADSLFDKAIAVRHCNALAWHGKAEIKFALASEQGKKPRSANAKESYQQAIALYQQALECNPKYSDASYKIGESYQRITQYPLALKAYSDAIKSDVNNVQAYISRGYVSMGVKQYAEAIADHSRATNLLLASQQAAKKINQKELVANTTADLSRVYQLTSQSWYSKNDFAKAVLLADKALELDEKNAEALYFKGLASEGLHDIPKALKCYADAIKYKPDFRYYYANGKALLGAEKYEPAISNFSQVLKLDTLPAIKDTRYLRGLSYFKNHMLDAAHKDFTDYAKLAGDDSGFYTDFGIVNLHLSHDAAAVENFQRTLALKPTAAQALYGLGCAYAKAGEFEQALKQFELAFQTRKLKKDDIKQEEESFLGEFNKVKANKTKYAQLKKTYLAAPATASN
jgi:tetratricopeptide (TPR) repeat protein